MSDVRRAAPTPSTITRSGDVFAAHQERIAALGRLDRRKVALVIRRARRRLSSLDRQYPSVERLSTINDPDLRALVTQHRTCLTAVATPGVTAAVLTKNIALVRDALVVFQASDTDTTATDADCVAGCDAVLKNCMESWLEMLEGEDIDLFDGEAETQTDDAGGISLEDNPFDVENNDAGDTGAADEEDHGDEHESGWNDVAVNSVTALICTLQFTVCLASCAIPG